MAKWELMATPKSKGGGGLVLPILEWWTGVCLPNGWSN
jgi:hypothetical protein